MLLEYTSRRNILRHISPTSRKYHGCPDGLVGSWPLTVTALVQLDETFLDVKDAVDVVLCHRTAGPMVHALERV